MRMTTDFILYGAKPVSVNLDGNLYDSTKIYLGLAIADGNGICTTEYNWGESSNYSKHLADLTLPCEVSVDFELVTTGKQQKTIIHDVKAKKSLAKATS